MTITLNLKPELEAGLLAQARATGTTPEDYVQHLVERDLSAEAIDSGSSDGTDNALKTHREQAVRRMLEFGDKYHLSLGEPVRRKLVHEGHRF